jgi:hypothetical protein
MMRRSVKAFADARGTELGKERCKGGSLFDDR